MTAANLRTLRHLRWLACYAAALLARKGIPVPASAMTAASACKGAPFLAGETLPPVTMAAASKGIGLLPAAAMPIAATGVATEPFASRSAAATATAASKGPCLRTHE